MAVVGTGSVRGSGQIRLKEASMTGTQLLLLLIMLVVVVVVVVVHHGGEACVVVGEQVGRLAHARLMAGAAVELVEHAKKSARI